MEFFKMGMLSRSSSSTSISLWGRRVRRIIPLLLLITIVSVFIGAAAYMINVRSKMKNQQPIIEERMNGTTVAVDRDLDKKMRINLENPLQPLVLEEDLADVVRPEIELQAESSNRIDYAAAVSKEVQGAMILKDKGYSFRVIVFAWKRLASLKRLVNSLFKSEYYGFTVHLDFHMDGGAHQKVLQYVDDLIWPHGRVRINRHAERVGLEKTIMESWQPVSDKEFAFFFEDDIEVSYKYFEYSLICLHKYLLPDGERSPSSVWTDKFIGVSLNTPRYNEIAMPNVDWLPTNVISEAESQFLFQLPCSWGALYVPWHWRSFLQYYNWRWNQTEEALHASVPDSATRYWIRSWKKYLVELMYMRGMAMIHPNMPNQLSFSTHHREPGEHTEAKPQEHLVEDLGTLVLDYFTVPLVKEIDVDVYRKMIGEMKPLQEMPVINFHHEGVRDIWSLSQLGVFTVDLMERYGWSEQKAGFDQHPNCILDRVIVPVSESQSSMQEKFLLYEPESTFEDQVTALRNAIAFSQILNRTLVVPPFIAPKNATLSLSIFDIFSLAPKDLPVASIGIGEFVSSKKNLWIDRVTGFVPWSERKSVAYLDDKSLLEHYRFSTSHQAILNFFSGHEGEILAKFSSCHDSILAMRRLHNGFIAFADVARTAQMVKWSREFLKLKESVATAAASGLPKSMACVVYSKGDTPKLCGHDVNTNPKAREEQKIVAYRSCQVTAERTIQYALDDAKTLNVSVDGVYLLLEDVSSGGSIPKTYEEKTSKRNLSIITRDVIIQNLKSNEIIKNYAEEIISEISILVESQICSTSKFFEGNVYSSRSAKILSERESTGLVDSSNTLGKKVRIK